MQAEPARQCVPRQSLGTSCSSCSSCGSMCRGELHVPRTSHKDSGNGQAATLVPGVGSGEEFLPAERCLEIYRIMLRARAMEERMIKMSKSGEGYFWIGG